MLEISQYILVVYIQSNVVLWISFFLSRKTIPESRLKQLGRNAIILWMYKYLRFIAIFAFIV